MALTPNVVAYGRASLTANDQFLTTQNLLQLDADAGRAFPNAHVAGTTLAVRATVSHREGTMDSFVAVAVVEDATDTNGAYASAADAPRTDLGVVSFQQLGRMSTIPQNALFNLDMGTKAGTLRVVIIFADSQANCRDRANVATGGTSTQYHIDADGYLARGGLATPTAIAGAWLMWAGRRARAQSIVSSIEPRQVYPNRPTLTATLAPATTGTQFINPKALKIALRDRTAQANVVKLLRPTPTTAGVATTPQYNVDTDFAPALAAHDLVVGVNDTLGDTSTPAAEKPGLATIPGATIDGLTSSQQAWLVFDTGGHGAGLDTDPAAPSGTITVRRQAAVEVGSRISIFKDSGATQPGASAYLTAANRTAGGPVETRFKRKSPTGSTQNAHPFLQAWVLDAAGTPIPGVSFVLAIRRTGSGATENQQTLASGSGASAGRLQWEYDIGTTDEAGNSFKKTSPDAPGSYKQKDVRVTGNAFAGVKEPIASAAQVFGANSEIQFQSMWTGDLSEANVDANGAPTGFANRTKSLGSGQLKFKVCSLINEGTGILADESAPNPRDAAGRSIDVSGAEALLGAKAIWNLTAGSIEDAATEIAAGNANHALDAPLGYSLGSGGDKGFEGKDTSGDARSLALYLAYADSRTQEQSFALTTDLTDVGFSADVGNYGYYRQVVQFVALDADLVIVAVADETLHPAGASPTVSVRTGKLLPDGTLVERKPDAPPVIYISRVVAPTQPLADVVIANMTAINPDAQGKSAHWRYTYASPQNGTYGVTVSCLISGSRPTGPGRTVFKVGVPDPDLELLCLATHSPGGAHARHVEAGDALHVVVFAKRRSTGALVDLDAEPEPPACALLRPGSAGGMEYWDGAAWKALPDQGPVASFALLPSQQHKTWALTFPASALLDPRDVIVVVYAKIAGVPYATQGAREVVGPLVNRHDAYAFDPIGFVTGLPTR